MKAQRTFNMKPNYYSIKGSKLNPRRQENSKQVLGIKLLQFHASLHVHDHFLKHVGGSRGSEII